LPRLPAQRGRAARLVVFDGRGGVRSRGGEEGRGCEESRAQGESHGPHSYTVREQIRQQLRKRRRNRYGRTSSTSAFESVPSTFPPALSDAHPPPGEAGVPVA